MRRLVENKKWLMFLCFGLALGMGTACGDDDKGSDDPDVIEDPDVIDDEDVTDPGEEDVTDPGEEDVTEDPDTTEEACDFNDFDFPSDLVLAEDDSYDEWGFYGLTDDGDYYELSIRREGGLDAEGTHDFATVNPNSDGYLRLGTNCGTETCDPMAISAEGTFDIIEFDKSEGGTFKAELTDVILRDIEDVDQTDGTITYGDTTWCIESKTIEVPVEPLPGPPVFEGVDCSDDDTLNGFTPESFYGAIDGNETITVQLVNDEDSGDDLQAFTMELYGKSIEGVPYEEGQTYQMDDVDYNTCIHCAFMLSDCEGNQCSTQHNIGAGELKIDTLDEDTGEFVATLSNAEFVEVDTVDNNTVIVENGSGWCIDELEISGTLDVAQTPDRLDCSADNVENGFDVQHAFAEIDTYSISFVGLNEDDFPADMFVADLWGDDYEAGQTYPVDTTDWLDCEQCVRIHTDCDDSVTCADEEYAAGAGEMTIDEMDEANGVFKATFKDLKFVEADMWGDPVPGGGGWCVDEIALEGDLTDITGD